MTLWIVRLREPKNKKLGQRKDRVTEYLIHAETLADAERLGKYALRGDLSEARKPITYCHARVAERNLYALASWND